MRVQLNNFWGSTKTHTQDERPQPILQVTGPDENIFQLYDEDDSDSESQDGQRRNIFYSCCKLRVRMLENIWFNRFMLLTVGLSVLLTASWPSAHPHRPSRSHNTFKEVKKYTEPIFVIIFDLEALLKIKLLGWRNYWKFGFNKFEFFLGVLGTLSIVPTDIMPYTVYFRCCLVLRIVRLVRVSSTLESFISKIFGPVKKMALLIAGSLSIILSMAMVSLQLFAPKECDPLSEERKRNHFCDFPRSAMAMFQVKFMTHAPQFGQTGIS